MRPASLRIGLTAAVLLAAGAASAQSVLDGVRFEGPRAGPGSSALHTLGECVREDDANCVHEVFHGLEAMQRVVRDALDGTLSIEREGLVARYRRLALAGGRDRYRQLLWGPIEACEVALVAATRGRCDDTGWVAPPPPPSEGAPETVAGLLEDFSADVGEGFGRRRARRVVCGMVRMGQEITAAEAIVVLADRAGADPAVVDVQCRTLDLSERDVVVEEGTAPTDPTSALVLSAFAEGLECLERSGGCIHRFAPLPGVLARDLFAHLEASPADRHPAVIERGRRFAVDHDARAERVSYLAPRQCMRLARVPAIDRCIATDHRPFTDLPSPPAGLGTQSTAQARAMVALLWGPHLDLSATRSRVTCRTQSGDVSMDVVWAKPDRAPPLLLDILCD